MGGHYRASLTAGDGKIFFTSMEGIVIVAKASEEFEVLARNKLDEGIQEPRQRSRMVASTLYAARSISGAWGSER